MSDRGSNAIEDAKKARAALEDHLDAVERAKATYHDAVRAAWAAGVPLRAIADELGLSHQRVHQMVSGDQQASASARRKPFGKAALTTLSVWVLRVLVVAIGAVGSLFASTHAVLALDPKGCVDVATGMAAVCAAPTPRFSVYVSVVLVAVACAAVAKRIRPPLGRHVADVAA